MKGGAGSGHVGAEVVDRQRWWLAQALGPGGGVRPTNPPGGAGGGGTNGGRTAVRDSVCGPTECWTSGGPIPLPGPRLRPLHWGSQGRSSSDCGRWVEGRSEGVGALCTVQAGGCRGPGRHVHGGPLLCGERVSVPEGSTG